MILEIINIMNEVKIELKFRNKPTRLYGEIAGENIYILAVEDNIDWNGKNIIIFPEYIENISISFVKGFTKKIFDNINKDEFLKYFKIIFHKSELIDKFIKSIYI